MKKLILAAAVVVAVFGLVSLDLAHGAGVVACTGPRGGFVRSPTCESNCCLVMAPVPNSAGVGAGICVEAQDCVIDLTELGQACNQPNSPFQPQCDSNCATGCCVTLIPNLSGLCVPADFCGGSCP